MAQIPVEHKKKSIWPWILGLLLLLGIIGLIALFAGDDDADELEAADIEAVEPAPMEEVAGPITSLAALEGMDDSLVGREVALEGLEVSELVGDRTFFVTEDGERLLVVLKNLGEMEPGPGTGADGVYNVDEGVTVSVYGTIDRVTPSMGQDIEGADMQRLLEENLYLNANRIQYPNTPDM